MVGVEKTSWEDTELNGKPAFKVQDDPDPEYGDASSPRNFMNFLGEEEYDFLRKRDLIKVDAATFNAMPQVTDDEKAEKAEICKNVAVVQADGSPDSVAIIGYYVAVEEMSQQDATIRHTQEMAEYQEKFIGVCANRVKSKVVNNILFIHLNRASIVDFLANIRNLISDLREYGYLGVNYDGIKGAMDYIESTNFYIGNGLAEEDYYKPDGTPFDAPALILDLKNWLLFGIKPPYAA